VLMRFTRLKKSRILGLHRKGDYVGINEPEQSTAFVRVALSSIKVIV
jgi:hypothetical protein